MYAQNYEVKEDEVGGHVGRMREKRNVYKEWCLLGCYAVWLL
jgi:hypothetical protein